MTKQRETKKKQKDEKVKQTEQSMQEMPGQGTGHILKNVPAREDLVQRIEQINTYMDRVEPFGVSAVVLVAIGDDIVLHKGYGFQDYEGRIRMDDDTVLSIGSISKQMTSVAMLKLLEREDIPYTTTSTLQEFFDDVPEDKQDITIHQLLTHTAGFVSILGDDFDHITTDEFVSQFLQSDLQFEPGTDFKYSNLGYSVAAIIIEKITGKAYQEYMRQEIFKPLDMTRTSWFSDPMYNKHNSATYYSEGKRTGAVYEWNGSWDTQQQYWHILGNGGVCTTAGEFFSYLRPLFDAKLFSKSSLDQMLTPELNDYGYGWDINSTELGICITHNGGSTLGVNAVTKYYKELDLTYILLGNSIINGMGIAFQLEHLIDEVLRTGEVIMPPEIPYNPNTTPKMTNETTKSENSTQTTQTTQTKGSASIKGEHIGEFGIDELDQSNRIIIEENRMGQILVKIEGQQLLNIIFNNPPQLREKYEYMNRQARQFGRYILEEKWQDAFDLCVRKTEWVDRVAILSKIMQKLEDDKGKITGVKVTGSLPFPDFLAMTQLNFESKTGHGGIPIIWQDDKEILGFRPLISEYPLSLFGKFAKNKIYVHSIEYQLSTSFNVNFGESKIYD